MSAQRTTGAARTAARVAAGLAALLTGALLALPTAEQANAATEAPQLSQLRTTTSAVTVAGQGPFAALRVTVGQTKNLVNQSVLVTWAGGAPTLPTTDRFAADYLQLMQCWGDADAGPTRDQCAFGARAATDDRGGDFAATRQIGGTGIVDPREDPKIFASDTPTFVPFTPVTGETAEAGNTNQFFDGNTTNEISFARTNANGSGSSVFEAQTANQNAGLGCGTPVAGVTHRCWLVVVPRSDVEVDGRVTSGNGGNGGGRENMISTSPLSLTNWQHRIVVPMAFAPLSGGCPLGQAERRTLGDELVTEAMLRWQPGLCKGGTVYGFSQVVSSTAHRKLASEEPGLVFTTTVAPPDSLRAPAAYAPVAVSALGIGLAVDTQLPASPAASEVSKDGVPVDDINLSQRVVAKLLTQTYQTAVPPGGRYLPMNPRDLTTDPDFLRDNPRFNHLKYDRVTDIMVPGASTDDYVRLWDWVLSDQSARAFLAGHPDPWGARVNPFYQGNTTASDSFPRLDPYCQRFGPPIKGYAPQTPLCALDAFPYTNDLHDAARSSSRGDSLARSRWNLALEGSDTPPGYKKALVQLPGRRSLLSLVDSATAARFGLPMAHLRNASGQFVAPTVPSVSSALTAMTRDPSTGVRSLAPQQAKAGAYPLTAVTYAATPPSELDVQEARELAGLIRYAVGPGQVPGSDPGMLAPGYLPLSAGLRAEALTVASAVERRVGLAGAPTPDSTPGDDPGSASESPAGPGGGSASPPPTGGLVSPSVTPSPNPTLLADAKPASNPTPGVPVGLIRYLFVAVLITGGAALIAAPALPWVARRLTRRTG